MNTLLQIESAVVGLPPEEQWSLLRWLRGRLGSEPGAAAAEPDALKVFRELQQEVALTPEGAAAWKVAVEEARR